MTLTFDKTKPLRPELWVDSICGHRSSTRHTPGDKKKGCVKILAREFNQGPYMELNLLMDSHQIDDLIQTLETLKEKMS